jgi:hypothetical protein
MKRIVLALLALALVSASSTVARASGLEFGIKAGLTSSTLKDAAREAGDPDPTTDVTGGIMLALPLGPTFAVQGEALLVSKGADIPRTSGHDQLRLRDIEFPVLARLSVPLGLPVTPFVVAGPTFGYNIEATIDPADPALPKTDLSDARKLDTGFALGAGAKASLGGIGLTLEGRYASSLEDVQDKATNAIPGKNALYTFMVGLVF